MHRFLSVKTIAVLCLTGVLSAQVFYSGWIDPNDMRRTKDGTEINLPFRAAELELNYSFSQFELRSRTAIESRWTQLDTTQFQLREAYAVWYPTFGEFKVGKQIHAWGLADGNNPTDNLNPYDYYYMFLTGIDRKVATLSASGTIYLGPADVEFVFLPQFEPNRLPFGEKDFPIELPPKPKNILDPGRKWESGLRFKTSIGNWDMDLSWFHGNDRMFSMQGLNQMILPDTVLNIPVMGYNKSDAYGSGFVWFPGNVTIRGEGMYVHSESPKVTGDIILKTKADYLQYVLQGEVNGPFSLTLMAQYLGTRVQDYTVTRDFGIIPLETATAILSSLPTSDYQPGLGTPFAIIAENGLMIGAKGNYLDDRIEVRFTSFKDLDHVGMMAGAGVSYSPREAWKIEVDGTWFFGDSNDPNNKFTQLEDFSNLRLGIKYSF